MSYLCLENISKLFNGVPAVTDISFTIERGEFLAVLGPSGCGKTTLLTLLSGICQPDSGTIFLEGRNITRLQPEKRNFGMVFQNYALFPNLTVAQNIAYGLFASPKSDVEKKVHNLIALTKIEGLENRLPMQLSGGQRQRVALARALAPDPSVLLLDEPLSALDAAVRMSLGQELLRLQRETGITTIMVTHDQQEALALADRVVLMNQGEIVQTGVARLLYEQPASLFAAHFIGHMNTIRLPEIDEECDASIRFEDVIVNEPSEKTLAQANTWVGRVEHAPLMGAFYRLTILLNDFRTRIHADVPRAQRDEPFSRGSLVAVTLPEEKVRVWKLGESAAPTVSTILQP